MQALYLENGMTNQEILSILKTDLEISSQSRDDYLEKIIISATTQIKREGIVIDSSSIDDGMLIERYAAFLYRKRREDGPMPRDLRRALNNRLFSQKMQVNS